MTDEYIESLLPACPAELTEQVHKKQFAHAREGVRKMVVSQREMFLPLGEDAVKAVVAGLKTYLLNFAAAKVGKLNSRKVTLPPKPAKVPTLPPTPPVVKTEVKVEEKSAETPAPTGK